MYMSMEIYMYINGDMHVYVRSLSNGDMHVYMLIRNGHCVIINNNHSLYI